MKSYINKLADFRQASFEWEVTVSCPEEYTDSQMRHLTRTFKRTEEPKTLEKGDVSVLALKSSIAKFNRPSVYVTVGGGLFDRELEEQILGRLVGESFEAVVDGTPVEVEVKQAARTIFPEPTDEMAASYAREHEEFAQCTTVESYRQQVIAQYLEEKRREAFFHMMSSVEEYVLTHSDFAFDEEEVESLYEQIMAEVSGQLEEMGKSLDQLSVDELQGYFGVENAHEARKELKNQAEWQVATALWLAHENGLDARAASVEELGSGSWEFLEEYVKENLKIKEEA